ncbi:MAG: hypothetical protein ACFCVH_00025 [Alphaproteobacteria bacterium]
MSASAHRVAALAAAEADLPIASWLALAILGTAAEQAGVPAAPDRGSRAGPARDPAAPVEPEPVQETLRRLEAKLDRVLGSPADAAAPRYD